MTRIIIGCFAFCLLVCSCQQNEDLTTIAVDVEDPQQITDATVQGIVINDNEQRIEGAKVEILQNNVLVGEVLTNVNGTYELDATLKSGMSMQMRVVKEGYITSISQVERPVMDETLETVLLAENMRGGARSVSLGDSLVLLTGQILNTTGDQVLRKLIIAESADQKMSYAYTARGGFFRIVVPSDEVIALSIVDQVCEETVFAETYGPFTTDQELGVLSITKNANDTYPISGLLVDCTGEVLDVGNIHARVGERSFYLSTNGNGAFLIDVPNCILGDSPTISATAFDENFVNASEEIILSLTGESLDLGTIEVCSNGGSSVTFIIEGDTLVADNLHSFNQSREGFVSIFPIQGREGLTLSFAGESTGTFTTETAKFAQGYLTAISDPALSGTFCEVEITTFTDGLLEGTFSGTMVRSNTRATIAISGAFSIGK